MKRKEKHSLSTIEFLAPGRLVTDLCVKPMAGRDNPFLAVSIFLFKDCQEED